MPLSQDTINQLQGYVQSGDAASYYQTLAANGHDYGNLAYEAATDTGFWGQYANNFLENKAKEYGINFDRNQVMRDLMVRDFEAREENLFEPISTDNIRDYHEEVFNDNGLPSEACVTLP